MWLASPFKRSTVAFYLHGPFNVSHILLQAMTSYTVCINSLHCNVLAFLARVDAYRTFFSRVVLLRSKTGSITWVIWSFDTLPQKETCRAVIGWRMVNHFLAVGLSAVVNITVGHVFALRFSSKQFLLYEFISARSN